MRVFFVPLIIAAMLSLSPVAVYANNNQAAADKIAAGLGSQFPGYDIAVKYQNGKVTLAGFVDSQDTAGKAADFVQKLQDVNVNEVENGLQIAPKASVAVRQSQPIVAVTPTASSARPNPAVAAPVPMPVRSHAAPHVAHEPQMAPLPQPPVGMQQYQQYQQCQQYHTHHQGMVHEPGLPYTHVAYAPEAYGPQGPLPGQYNQPNLPEHAWPSYAAYPNYAEVCYPRQYTHKAWPYIGPFYPYPQVPTGWRKVSLEWHDGNWWLDFDEGTPTGPFSPIFRQPMRYTF